MNMWNRRGPTGALLVALAVLAAACSAPAEDATDSVDTEGEPAELVPGPGFDGETIDLGILVPLSGLPAIIGEPLAAGQETYWDYVNDELGGVAGEYPVNVMIEDTLYETNTTVQQYNKIKEQVVMFSQVMGTPHNLALLPLLEDDNIVVSPASQDSLWVREQQLFPVIGPYQIDVINAMDYYLNEAGGEGSTVCAIIENDVYGEAGLAGLEFAAENLDFEIETVTRFRLDDGDFTAQITALRNADCEMVWATALPSEFGGIIGKSAEMGFTPQWIAQAPAWVEAIGGGDVRDYLEANVWIASTGYEPGDVSTPGMQALVERRDKYRPDQGPDYYFTFGYLQAMAVHQLLEEAIERGDLSRDGIVAAMESVGTLEFDGLLGDYEFGPPEDRVPSVESSVFKINMDKPFGLEALKTNFTTDLATEYEF